MKISKEVVGTGTKLRGLVPHRFLHSPTHVSLLISASNQPLEHSRVEHYQSNHFLCSISYSMNSAIACIPRKSTDT
jgi:hypothetical protein